jgi:FixJ family two-component response regulator
VDDDADLIEVLTQLFLDAGAAECVAAHSLAEVEAKRERALACTFALVDVNLGRGKPTGLDVHRWLTAQGFAGRIVFLTGHAHSDPMVKAAAQMSGAKVLTKPIDADVLTSLAEGNP